MNFRLLSKLWRWIDKRRIQRNSLIDVDYYVRQSGVFFESESEAWRHYVREGAEKGLAPNAYFDARWYAQTYGVSGKGVAPLLDFFQYGRKFGRSPSVRFDLPGYLSRNPDVAQASVNPLSHFLTAGRREGRAPTYDTHVIIQSGLLDLEFYNLQSNTRFASAVDAANHYVEEGAAVGFNPNAYFDTRWYLSTYLDVARDGRNPLVDFLAHRPAFDRNPSPDFDCKWYLSYYPDLKEVNNPLQHFIVSGQREGRAASPFAGDPRVPVRFANLLSDVVLQDGEFHFQGCFDVRPVPESLRLSGPVEAAASERTDLSPNSKAWLFPPRPYIAVFRDVGFIGGSRLILGDATTVLSDEISTFWTTPKWAVRPYDFNIDKGGRLTLQLRRSYPSRVERGAHLMHEYSGNYFHMVTELLPRLLAAEKIGLDPTLPLLIQDGLHPNLRRLVDILNERDRQIIPLQSRKVYTAGELHFISDVASIQDVYERPRQAEETVLHRGLTRLVADRIIAALDPLPPAKPWRRIYVRRGNRYRGLLNEQVVEELLLKEGFEVVLMDGLSIAAQVHLFRQAAVVVAPTGAAVTNILWCQPGAGVCVISADHDAMPVEVWRQLAEVAGVSFTSLSCKRAYDQDGDYSLHDNYSVDLADLKEVINRFR